MAEVIYNINGTAVLEQFAGNTLAILPREVIPVTATGTILTSVTTTDLVTELTSTTLQEAQLALSGNEVLISPLDDAFPQETRITQVEYREGDPFPINTVNVLYRFYSSLNTPDVLFIKEVSIDGTEVRLGQLSGVLRTDFVDGIRNLLSSELYLPLIRLEVDGEITDIQVVNIGVLDNNVVLKLVNTTGIQLQQNSNVRLFREVAQPVEYTVSATIVPDLEVDQFLRGANFDIELEDSSKVSTEYLNYDQLYTLPVTSSNYFVLTNTDSLKVNLNIDYTNFENFVHFSSAKERLINFKYKLDLLHTYETEKSASAAISSASLAINTSNLYYDNLISGILGKFDGYESYLYYTSGSKAWPKANSTTPYINMTSSAALAQNWFTAEYATASLYDELNESALVYTIPEYLRQDTANTPYLLFVNLIGQHFDTLWTYAKDVSNRYNADNRVDYGVSKDLIAKTLQSFGIKLYSSNFATSNLTSLLLGEWYNSGSEQINTFVTASSNPTPDKDILVETYKRIYHNLPYLIKTKGTERGLRALINIFGIPSGSLDIRLYGGVERPGATPYFASSYPTGSKIRLNNTGSIVAGSTLSQYVSIQKDDKKFTQDQHIVEIGFSPSHNIDKYILSGSALTGSFNIDQYIGDPRYLHETNYNSISNANLYEVAETLLSGSAAYDVFDFIRLIKFFDNQLFKMVKDFVPARDVTTSGIIIKPHILNRSKAKSPEVSWTQPEYSASIDTAFIEGADGDIIGNYSTAHTASVPGLLGTVTEIRNTEVEKYNGELGGTVIDLYTGSLNDGNIFLQVNHPELRYNSTGSATNIFPTLGEYTWKYLSAGPTSNRTLYVDTLYISAISKDNLNINQALSRLNPGDTIKYQISGSVTDGSFPPVTTQVFKTLTGKVAAKQKYNNPLGQPVWSIKLETSNVVTTGFDSILETFNYGTVTDVKVIVEPFLNESINFYNSEFNAVINNANTIANAAEVQKVDYSTNPLVPVNLAAIRANTAEKAEVQEYVHSSAGYVRGRYKGKQLTGALLNEFTAGDTSYGKTPVIESTIPYFCVFDYISGFSPEHNQANAIVLSYIVDEEGNLITPDSPVALPILQQSFPSDSEFNISIQGSSIGGTEVTLVGPQTTLRAGTRLEPILYSYTAATYLNPVYSATSKLEFDVDDTLDTYDMVAAGSGTQSPNTSPPNKTVATFSVESKDDQNYYNTGTSTYTFVQDTEQPVKFSAFIETTGTPFEATYGYYSTNVRYAIEVSSDGTFSGPTTATLASSTVTYSGGTSFQEVELSSTFTNFNAGSAIRVTVQPQDPYLDSLVLAGRNFQATSFASGSTFVQQSDNGQGFFFTTSSAATNTTLTASLSLSSKYDNLFVGISGSASAGFNTVTQRFTVQRGDQIKFNNDESRVFMVTEVETPSQNVEQTLYITLDNKPNLAVNKDFFVIRRYVDTNNMILMKTDRVAGTQNAGILFPKYPSARLKANYENIISNLKNKGIL